MLNRNITILINGLKHLKTLFKQKQANVNLEHSTLQIIGEFRIKSGMTGSLRC